MIFFFGKTTIHFARYGCAGDMLRGKINLLFGALLRIIIFLIIAAVKLCLLIKTYD